MYKSKLENSLGNILMICENFVKVKKYENKALNTRTYKEDDALQTKRSASWMVFKCL